ncbi:MAG: glycerol-3-phosphate 1-O-acyltransferase PlsY [Chromatiales bacterium]
MVPALLVLFSYLIGSLSTAIIVCRIVGAPDPRTVGSRNPGATNVLRVAGRKAAAATLLGDSLKGLLPVLVGRLMDLEPAALAAAGFAAFLGHLFPVFFRFQGGKGVATFIGVLLGLALPVGLFFIAVWLLVAKLVKISSLAALGAAFLAPFLTWLLGYPLTQLAVILAMVALLFWRHRANIRKLIDGTEPRIGASSSNISPDR